uniref:Osteoclast-stimulating factor 1 n=1 Tax=Gasterosteus aculeatus aculeatus TaxID=481459 RepID=G3NSR6_GASAC
MCACAPRPFRPARSAARTSSLAETAKGFHTSDVCVRQKPYRGFRLFTCRASQMSKPPPKPAKPGQVKVFRALFTFDPRTPDELFFEEGDFLYISDTTDSNWWKGTCRGRTGLIPSNYGNLSWLRECVENKVGINGLDKAGNTPLYWACHGGHKEVVEVLLSQTNVELNQQNKLGDTALHAAAWKGYSDIVEMLLNKDARTDVRNNENKLALEMSTNPMCASLLKKKQAGNTTRLHSNAEEYLDDEDSD